MNAGLGVTAGHCHKGIGRMSQCLANDVSAGPFCIFCHGAGIDDEQVCWFAEFDDTVAIALQASREYCCLCLVQSAAKCVERGAFHDSWAIIGRSLRWEQGSLTGPSRRWLSSVEGRRKPW